VHPIILYEVNGEEKDIRHHGMYKLKATVCIKCTVWLTSIKLLLYMKLIIKTLCIMVCTN